MCVCVCNSLNVQTHAYLHTQTIFLYEWVILNELFKQLWFIRISFEKEGEEKPWNKLNE